MRLIDADAIPVVSADPYEEAAFRDTIADMQTIDAVPVVRCKDCMFYLGHRCQATRGLDDWRNQDDYCSRAERG